MFLHGREQFPSQVAAARLALSIIRLFLALCILLLGVSTLLAFLFPSKWLQLLTVIMHILKMLARISSEKENY